MSMFHHLVAFQDHFVDLYICRNKNASPVGQHRVEAPDAMPFSKKLAFIATTSKLPVDKSHFTVGRKPQVNLPRST